MADGVLAMNSGLFNPSNIFQEVTLCTRGSLAWHHSGTIEAMRSCKIVIRSRCFMVPWLRVALFHGASLSSKCLPGYGPCCCLVLSLETRSKIGNRSVKIGNFAEEVTELHDCFNASRCSIRLEFVSR